MSDPFDVHRLVALRRLGAAVPSPCGRFLVVAAARLDADGARYISDLWRLDAADPDAPAVQLTRGDASDRNPRFRADGALLFVSDRPRPGASEDEARPQVWCLPAGGGEPWSLTDEPLGVDDFRVGGDTLVVRADVWPGVEPHAQRAHAEDRKKHGPSAIRYTQMPVRFWDHWLPEAAPHYIAYTLRGACEEATGRRDLTPEADREHRIDDWDLSPDGRRLTAVHEVRGSDGVTDSCIAVVSTADGSTRRVGGGLRVQTEQPHVAPDSRRLAVSHHQRRDGALGRPTIRVFDLDDPDDPGRDLAEDWDVWPRIEGWAGDHILCAPDTRGHVPVFTVHSETGDVVRCTADAAGGAHTSVHALPGSAAIVGLRHTVLHPPEAFRLPLAEDAQPTLLARLSGFEPSEGEALAEVLEIEVAAPDGAPVHTLVLRPKDADGPRPLLLWIHGGPIAAHGDLWHWRWNALLAAAAGYVVALPNPRGSTGYGQAFIEGIWNNTWGAACYTDLMAVTDALCARDDVDETRTIAMGGSFGGYMTNWIGSQTDRFDALVTHASLYDLSSFHGVTDEPSWLALEFGLTPDEDREAFDRWSPERFLKQWKTPTLVIHGEKDYRVPISEGLALFEGLQRMRVPSELLIFPDENHWILKPRNIVVWYEAWQEFVKAHLPAG
jgi:dipeptidyl aminopeptidase/acylaminoacyl peptidase